MGEETGSKSARNSGIGLLSVESGRKSQHQAWTKAGRIYLGNFWTAMSEPQLELAYMQEGMAGLGA